MKTPLIPTLCALALCGAATAPLAHADDNALWSLAIGVPGLMANVGNAYPVVPQPVYVAPPVQYVPAPGYYVVPPAYGPRPPYREYRHRREHDERRHWGEDDGDH